jgi:hypothetical protein
MERGGFPLFFFGEKMLTNLLCVIGGMIMMRCLSFLLGLGHSVNILKETQQGCALMFTSCEQGVQEILQLKYMAMKEADRSEQNIIAQKYIDQMNVTSLKDSIMRNYIATFPPSYSSVMEYQTWEELADYVNQLVKNNKENRQ